MRLYALFIHGRLSQCSSCAVLKEERVVLSSDPIACDDVPKLSTIQWNALNQQKTSLPDFMPGSR